MRSVKGELGGGRRQGGRLETLQNLYNDEVDKSETSGPAGPDSEAEPRPTRCTPPLGQQPERGAGKAEPQSFRWRPDWWTWEGPGVMGQPAGLHRRQHHRRGGRLHHPRQRPAQCGQRAARRRGGRPSPSTASGSWHQRNPLRRIGGHRQRPPLYRPFVFNAVGDRPPSITRASPCGAAWVDVLGQ